ncbi:hypothetical protein [Neorhizobium sp. DAR64860/K0K1]|uniref:hypothetical protein n=1 Tax=Neorhizobium sp. DAR64860/K0K1 TaxID=3421955 RepID=UPI003D28A24D
MKFFLKLVLTTAALQLEPAYARADLLEMPQSVALFGGAMVNEDMFAAADFVGANYESNTLLGLGYQVFPYQIGAFNLGLEAGLAGRFGRNASGEVWGGAVGRYDALGLGSVRISPSFTFGLSHVTQSQKGRERDHEQKRDGDARTLFYLAPEVSFARDTAPDTEVFWRLHHRSGAWGTLGDMHGGSNANVIGVRSRF